MAIQLTLPDVLRALIRGDGALLNHAGWQGAALAVIDELEAAAAPGSGQGSAEGKGEKGGGDG